MIKFPSIEQFRNVIYTVRQQHDWKGRDSMEGSPVYEHTSPYPILTFRGAVKLHGTNGGIVRYKDGRTEFQSRNRVLSLGSDNSGFMTTMSGKNLEFLFEGIKFKEYIAVFGEWVGEGIQKGVGISELDRRFVIFGCNVDGNWIPYTRYNVEIGIYNIEHFPQHTIKIDFNTPELSTNEIIQRTVEVEEECPVAKFFGVNGIGEGLVYTCVENPHLRFKSKGEKHSSSKVKILSSVDVEKLESYKEFVDYACTENRMTQGLEEVDLDIKQTGDFIRWVANDILKEESDTLVRNGIEWKSVASMVAKKASEFFKNKLNKV